MSRCGPLACHHCRKWRPLNHCPCGASPIVCHSCSRRGMDVATVEAPSTPVQELVIPRVLSIVLAPEGGAIGRDMAHHFANKFGFR